MASVLHSEMVRVEEHATVFEIKTDVAHRHSGLRRLQRRTKPNPHKPVSLRATSLGFMAPPVCCV